MSCPSRHASAIAESEDEPAEQTGVTDRARLSTFAIAAWFGLAAGLLELILLVVRVRFFEGGFFLRSRQFLWMVPVSELAIFGSWGLLVTLVIRLGLRIPLRVLIAGFLFLACMSQFLLVRGLHVGTCALLSAGIAYQVSAWVVARFSVFRGVIVRTIPALLAAVGALVAVAIAWEYLSRGPVPSPPMALAAAGPAQAQAPLPAPNVLLIVLDTVRADRLSLYGYRRATTPNLAQLADGGVMFRHARSTAPWTLPSHASLLTGRWPHELLVERLGRLDDRYPTLPEFLGRQGYSTGGFVANQFFCGYESGLARGFQTYRDYPVTPGAALRASSLGWFLSSNVNRLRERLLWAFTAEGPDSIGLDFPRKTAADVNREFLDWVDAKPQQPFFAFLNYFDAHDPYLPPTRPREPFGRTPRTPAQFAMLRDWQKLDRGKLDPASLELAKDSYDDCLASLDRDLGQLFDALRSRGLMDNTLLIVTADHGEQFGEHGAFGHGMSLFEPEVHVPLLLSWPGRLPAGLKVDDPVSLRDLAATVVDSIGCSPDCAPFPGTPLSHTWSGPTGKEPPSRMTCQSPPLSELESPIEAAPGAPVHRGPSRAILAGQHTYLRYGDGAEELYDLAVDPGETQDLRDSSDALPLLEKCRLILGRLLGAATGDTTKP